MLIDVAAGVGQSLDTWMGEAGMRLIFGIEDAGALVGCRPSPRNALHVDVLTADDKPCSRAMPCHRVRVSSDLKP